VGGRSKNFKIIVDISIQIGIVVSVMNEQERQLAEKILAAMESNRFEKWYNNRFMPFIKGDTNAPSRDEILLGIVHMMNLYGK
jgi:hypothetical protein